jgi:hypothetical protein
MLAPEQRRFADLDSFREIMSEPNQIAGLYFFATLDCLLILANRVAHDFFERPHLYTDLAEDEDEGDGTDPNEGPPLALTIARLHAREGSEERFLDWEQRRQIYSALFGPGLGANVPEGDFGRLSWDLINACAAFAERVYDTGVEMLRERVRTAHRPFKEYLIGLHGASVRWSADGALAVLTEVVAYPILRNRGVASVFGIARPTTAAWPYAQDANGDKLVEEISRQLVAPVAGIAPGEPHPLPDGYVTRERFSNLQRAGTTGALALRAALDFSEDGTNDELDRLITACYTWGSTLVTERARPAAVTPGAATEPVTDGALAGTAPLPEGGILVR